ncbi:hypothetical protein BD310DRAFT_940225 [Dichomitus squalens]|uniref:Uncharacterized protein n=1 Tax=Dichomitus squalens TaxID=114155 RepID=A0A4Q9PGT6_9APHY|nr:hypothetical protein BD310DRAFT_940225 [Dichomitus squalens]
MLSQKVSLSYLRTSRKASHDMQPSMNVWSTLPRIRGLPLFLSLVWFPRAFPHRTLFLTMQSLRCFSLVHFQKVEIRRDHPYAAVSKNHINNLRFLRCFIVA